MKFALQVLMAIFAATAIINLFRKSRSKRVAFFCLCGCLSTMLAYSRL